MPERSEQELNQEYEELLQELRVSMPGLQVLFAFLLILPFSNGFDRVTQIERGVYLTSFVFAGVASAVLIAPSVLHRILWRQHDKEAVLRISNRLAITGSICLALAITCSVYLVTSYVYETLLAAVIAGLIALLICSIWYVLPLRRARKRD